MIYVEIVIATAFILFLASSLVSGVNELGALLLNKRGRELQRALRLAFPELDDQRMRSLYSHPLIAPLKETPKRDSLRGGALNLINLFRLNKYNHDFLPSYLDSELFAKALADVLVLGQDLSQATDRFNDDHRQLYSIISNLDETNYAMATQLFPEAGTWDTQSLPALQQLLQGSVTDFETLKNQALAEIRGLMDRELKKDDQEKYNTLVGRYLMHSGTEAPSTSDFLTRQSQNYQDWLEKTKQWYETYMNRVSGWYKKRAHTNIFWWSLALIVFLDLNILTVIDELFRNESLRALWVENAEKVNMEQASQSLEETYTQLSVFVDPGIPSWKEFTTNITGWLVTTFAVSLGAPFWFDVLSKAVKLRAAGKAPNESQKSN